MKKILFLLVFIPVLSHAVVNLRTSPIQLTQGDLLAELDIPVAPAWTVGPLLGYTSTKYGGYDVKAYSFGARANYYLNGNALTQGWYLGPSLRYINVKAEQEDTVYGPIEGEASGFGAVALIGHQWMWENFNINTGLGFYYYSIEKITVQTSNGSYKESYKEGLTGSGISAEFTLGWKFN